MAGKRGLKNLKTTLDALPELISEPSMALFEKYAVFNHREMHSRYEIGLEQYALTIGVEARLTLEIGATVILIEQAKGVVSESGEMTMDEAFATLRKYARDNNLTLTKVATAVIDRALDLGTLLGARGSARA